LAALQRRIQAAQEEATQGAAMQNLLVGGKFIEVTRDNAKVRGGADFSAPVELSAKMGQKLPVLDRSNDFYAVGLPDGKAGWITSADVKPTVIDPETASKLNNNAVLKNWKGAKIVNDTDDVATLLSSAGAQISSALSEKIYKAMTDAAVGFKDSYKDNPYFSVTGFTVVVSLPPALNLDFSFK
jgi:SH3 domain-containing protein